jgi:predicted nucleotidyltransferase component of viral defense system
MATNYLHAHPDFGDLILILSEKMSIAPVLIEKDYWIMQCLYGLQAINMKFYLKGGTSLSKAFGIINRFSEDIDILIEPPYALHVATKRNQDKTAHCMGCGA